MVVNVGRLVSSDIFGLNQLKNDNARILSITHPLHERFRFKITHKDLQLSVIRLHPPPSHLETYLEIYL